MRNRFIGGPHNGTIILSQDLLTIAEMAEYFAFEEYDGSGEPYEHQFDGVMTRDWHWKEEWAGTTPDTIAPTEGEPEAVPDPSAHVPTDGLEEMFSEDTESDPAEKPTDEVSEPSTPTAVDSAPNDLRSRRAALKLSRKELAAKTGLTEGVIARVETKGGKPEEVAAYEAGLE